MQLALFKPRGGKRRGAGRPLPEGKRRASERHERRATLKASEPVHVTIRVVQGLGSLRTRALYLAIREATITVTKHARFRIIQMSVQTNHVHLLVEAADRTALAKGMQGFQIAAARYLNKAVKRQGQVFPDRYHAHILKTPREVRHALAYVLNNWRRHGQDRGRSWNVDPFSSGVAFGGWRELEGSLFHYRPPATYFELIVWFPKTWLLREGWKRHGAPSVREVPGKRSA